jgi:hypothetical protein
VLLLTRLQVSEADQLRQHSAHHIQPVRHKQPQYAHCLLSLLPPPLQINCGSIAPITASQFGTNRFMERTLMQRAGSQQLSSVDRFGCAAVAGAVSALVASPTELIIIQQQVSRSSTCTHNSKQQGAARSANENGKYWEQQASCGPAAAVVPATLHSLTVASSWGQQHQPAAQPAMAADAGSCLHHTDWTAPA